jgi:hypothetical protein
VAAEVKLVLDGAAMDELLKGRDGPVVRHMTQVMDRTIVAARTHIHRGFIGPLMKGAGGATLENALLKRYSVTEAGPVGTVVAEKFYAYWVHEGNDPGGGRIYPKHSKVLVFVVQNGNFVFAKSVKASKPNPFLRKGLEEAMSSEIA